MPYPANEVVFGVGSRALVVAVDPVTHRAYDADNVPGAPSAPPRVVNLDELSPGLPMKAFANGVVKSSPHPECQNQLTLRIV